MSTELDPRLVDALDDFESAAMNVIRDHIDAGENRAAIAESDRLDAVLAVAWGVPITREPTQPTTPALLASPQEVADACGLHYRTVLRAIESGALPASRIGNRLRVRRTDMADWIERNAVEVHVPTAPTAGVSRRRAKRSPVGSLSALHAKSVTT